MDNKQLNEEAERLSNNNDEEFSPEDFLPSPPRKKGFLQRVPSLVSINPALILFLLFLFLSLASWEGHFPEGLWASYERVYQHKEYWRLITSLFVHADMKHLMDNSLLFLIFGSLLYFFYGIIVFPITSLLIGIITSAISVYFHEPQIRMLGASGMIYGMVAMWTVLYIRYEIHYSLPMRIFRVLGFCLIILFPTSFHMEVDYLAHAVGFFIGIFAGLLSIIMTAKRVENFY